MRAVLDACVLYPTVMREMLLGVAGQGLFTPLWSPRLLEEWARAAAKAGPLVEAQARGEIALTRAAWPEAEIILPAEAERRFWLPDPADVHVLAAAVRGSADAIVTMNARDFPRNILAEEGLSRADPDSFLLGFHAASPELVGAVADRVLATAQQMSGEEWTIRKLLRKARLPRLGKALERG
ncbi:RSP_2648 family PIN domain-containing protein [Pseudooceanicola sp.]|uniref:RSP_2648 family PIN domain-containing protein n=1 Tax=Pseudooceanicola sp. TaxID=1914328 RepID=UPI002627A834|nr:PIN domain-containing protein [Pseudooceanicola sp.]MDF1857135.1 PIN domain-containing protein [Pseudooceanicola sp.]